MSCRPKQNSKDIVSSMRTHPFVRNKVCRSVDRTRDLAAVVSRERERERAKAKKKTKKKTKSTGEPECIVRLVLADKKGDHAKTVCHNMRPRPRLEGCWAGQGRAGQG